ncbi:MAG: class aldolase/adducin family protein [Mycobacterium sp.]|jgi:L-fuculose-phosphate aldolase|nr:class aldolase/adducin family protein [Mycobacterium sp.]
MAITTAGPLQPPRLMPDLTPQAEVAVLARALYREGYEDHIAGHISYKQPDGTFLVNPFELAWDEITASDILRIDADLNVLEGRLSANGALRLHMQMHEVRDDLAVIVHNHSQFGTLWADAQRVPPIYDQTGALLFQDIALYNEYDGVVGTPENAQAAVSALGNAQAALLANHGVLITARSINEAYVRSLTLEWRCRQAWYLEAMNAGVEMKPEVAAKLGRRVDRVGYPCLWEAMVRREIRADAGVLS